MLKRFGAVGIDEVDARASRADPFAVATVDGDGVDLFAVEEVARLAVLIVADDAVPVAAGRIAEGIDGRRADYRAVVGADPDVALAILCDAVEFAYAERCAAGVSEGGEEVLLVV